MLPQIPGWNKRGLTSKGKGGYKEGKRRKGRG